MCFNFEISDHAKQRAKQRFNLKPKSLKRTVLNAIQKGHKIYQTNYKDSFVYVHGHFNFVFKNIGNTNMLITVTNLSAKEKYKESITKPTFRTGKCVGSSIIKRSIKSE